MTRTPRRATVVLLALLGLAQACGQTTPIEDLGTDGGGDTGGRNDLGTDSGTDSALDVGPDAGLEDIPVPDCGGQTTCGVLCADLDNDPDNCGQCGRTCIIANASPGCTLGQCAISSCEDGYLDVDGEVSTGCEALDTCTPDQTCATTCSSEGTTVCTNGVESCEPPAETCNMVDDDCNAACDEGELAGCRSGVHRSSGNGHLYTNDLTQASGAPFNLERENYFFVYTQAVPESRPLFLCRKGDGKHLLTDDTACEMLGGVQRMLGYWSAVPTCGAVPLHRLYHAATNNHFYTLNAGERDNAINNLAYVSQGIAGYVWTGR